MAIAITDLGAAAQAADRFGGYGVCCCAVGDSLDGRDVRLKLSSRHHSATAAISSPWLWMTRGLMTRGLLTRGLLTRGLLTRGLGDFGYGAVDARGC
jgi:hypothetical protein